MSLNRDEAIAASNAIKGMMNHEGWKYLMLLLSNERERIILEGKKTSGQKDIPNYWDILTGFDRAISKAEIYTSNIGVVQSDSTSEDIDE